MVGVRIVVSTVVAMALTGLATTSAVGKTPGSTYCYKDVCHRVKSIGETAAETGIPNFAVASFYDEPSRDPFNPSLITSSGEVFRALDSDTAASPIYPNGTRLLVFAPATGGAAVVRINNAGPYWSGRMLDLSRGAAEKLGVADSGLADVETLVVAAPTHSEARYEIGRTYAPVPVYLGRFETLAAARSAWSLWPASEEEGADGRIAEQEPGGRRTAGIADPLKATATRRTRVVLKPVRARRPLILAALAKRKSKVAAVKSRR